MVEIIKLSKIKPYVLKEISGVPYKRERVLCQFRKDGERRFIPMNEAACQWTDMITCLGWLGLGRLNEAKRFVEVEIVR